MLNIVVFNWNYSEFLKKLLSEMQVLFNNPQFRILICDDGSTDHSLKMVNNVITKFNIENIFIFESNKPNKGREKPYLGQIESLNNVMNSNFFSTSEHYWLMDADDYCRFSTLDSSFIEKIKSKKICFTTVKNITRDGIISDVKIKRTVLKSKNLFPSISVTSSIIVSGEFLLTNKQYIFDDRFDDVWLDSRLNMLACLLDHHDVEYIDECIFRLIHGSNDSSKMSLSRILKKQIYAHNYFKFIHNNKIMFSPRMCILNMFSKFFHANKL
ncbi:MULTISPECIES: glycosyltransferase [unclassified Providencia]|uniref:glycosyltransferase n=1 Tax=unclassified Providencia TaxID=2633465 RepID=UPI0023497E30|nr:MULTISPECIES: glycosyltransferase [unclassified Providencia]